MMAENLRGGRVWRSFMRAPEVRRAVRLAGLDPVEPRAVLAVLPP